MSTKRHDVFAEEIIGQTRAHFKSQRERNSIGTITKSVELDPKIEPDANFCKVFSKLVGEDHEYSAKRNNVSELKNDSPSAVAKENVTPDATLQKAVESTPQDAIIIRDDRSIFEGPSPSHDINELHRISEGAPQTVKDQDEKSETTAQHRQISVFERLSGHSTKD